MSNIDLNSLEDKFIGGPLHQMLGDAVRTAGLSAYVVTEPGSTLPALALIGSRGMPCGYRDDPKAWFIALGIEAELLSPDVGVGRAIPTIAPRTEEAVASLVNALTQTQAQAREVVRAMQAVFAAKNVDGYVAVFDAKTITLTFKEWNDLVSLVTICLSLGAADVADDLKLERRGHKRELLRRLRLLLIGLLGPCIDMTFEAGCAHAPDCVEIRLGLAQTLTLADRLTQASSSTDAPAVQLDEGGAKEGDAYP